MSNKQAKLIFDNKEITFRIYTSEEAINNSATFNGHKITHPIPFKQLEENIYIRKTSKAKNGKKIHKKVSKIITSNIYGDHFENEEIREQLKTAKYHIKFDGQCGFVKFDPKTNEPSSKKLIPKSKLDKKIKGKSF